MNVIRSPSCGVTWLLLYRLRLKEEVEEEEVAYTKILACTNKTLVTDLGRYLYKGKCKWFNRLTPNDL
jgi:hypothetical protein